VAANGLCAARMRWSPVTEHHAGQLVSLLQRDERPPQLDDSVSSRRVVAGAAVSPSSHVAVDVISTVRSNTSRSRL
jgi:hypothetical protein